MPPCLAPSPPERRKGRLQRLSGQQGLTVRQPARGCARLEGRHGLAFAQRVLQVGTERATWGGC